MRRFVLLSISIFIGISIISHLNLANNFSIDFVEKSNTGSFLQTLIELVKALILAIVLIVIWLTDIGYSVNNIGGMCEKKSHALGQSSEGTSSEI